MNEKKQLFIRGDLNDFYDGKIPLRNPKYMDMLKAEYGGIFDGQKIWLFEITKKNGKYDPTIFPGVIKVKKNEFEIHVNESDMTSTKNIVVSASASCILYASAATYTGVKQSGFPDAAGTGNPLNQ